MFGYLLHLIFRVGLVFLEVDGHEGRLDVCGGRHKDFLQSRDTQGHVSATVTCQMERIQCHLS